MTASPAARRTHRFLFPAAIFALFLLALAMRLPELSARPMHADEAVHAVKFADLWQNGEYRYDPEEFHGPILYFPTLPVMALRGRADFAATVAADYRLIPALFGSALVLLMPLLADALGGRRAATAAAVIFAVSPAFVYYSDDYIQEIPFVFFTLAAIGCGWRWSRRPLRVWAIAGGVCVGLAIASKETVALSIGAAAVASFLLFALRVRDEGKAERGTRTSVWRDGALAVFAAVLGAALLLTNHFSHPRAMLDYLRAVLRWTDRGATAELHGHSWSYYGGLIFWSRSDPKGPIFSEALIGLLAVFGALSAMGRWKGGQSNVESSNFARWLTVYTVVLAVAYSVIPYKTPWCVLSVDAGLVLLAGIGVEALWRAASGAAVRFALSAALVIGFGQLGWQAWRAAGPLCADSRNPYVYAGTAPEIDRLTEKLDSVLTANGEDQPIQVCVRDGYYWPLPWYLRRYSRVGYWSEALPAAPQLEQAAVVIGSTDWDDELTRRLSATHLMTGYIAMRIGVPVEIWVRQDLWKAYLLRRKPTDDDE